MKKLELMQTMEITGGATKHYHWFCNINNFRSKRYATLADAESAAAGHRSRYPSHYYNTYVITCTGNCK